MEYTRTIGESDYRRLTALTRAARGSLHPQRAIALDEGLTEARVLYGESIDLSCVALGSTFRIVQENPEETFEYMLTLPGEADISRGRLSVLTPLGSAVLGRRQGESFDYESPGGRISLRLESVTSKNDATDAT